MPDKKKDKVESSEEKKEKKDAKKGFFQSFLEPLFDQITAEYMRPLLKNVPSSILVALRDIGVGKILPLIGIITSGLLEKKEAWWSGPIGDTLAEGTAELRRLMNEAEGGANSTEANKETTEKGKQKLINVFLNPEFSDELGGMLTALYELLKNKDDKEKSKLLTLLGQLSPTEMYNFLSRPDQERQTLLSIFLTKTKEKTLKESIKDMKTSIRKTKAEMEVIKKEILTPAWEKIKPGFEKAGETLKEIDSKCAQGTKIQQKITGIRSWAKRLRDEEKAKH